MTRNRKSISSLAAALFTLTACAARAQNSIPVPSTWKGLANVAIAGKVYQLPAILDIQSQQTNEETNPVRVFLGIGNQAQIGSCLLASALETTTPYTFRQMTLQYMNVRWGGNSVSATLANTQADLGSVINSFTTPNLSAAYAPDYLKGMYSTMPMTTESYFFQTGTSMAVQLDQDGTLVGSVRGAGQSYTAIFSTPRAEYLASFRLTRIK